MTYLDTHVIIWLYSGETSLLPAKAVRLIENNEILVSPMSILEMQYLREIKRISADPYSIIRNLEAAIGLKVSDLPFQKIVGEAVNQVWTRDPFDRIIVANASIEKSPLITKDAYIHKHYKDSVWE